MSSPRPRALFFGTPEFAATILERLLRPDSPVAIVGVVTQPDRPAGRRQELTAPPVKGLAGGHGIPVLQPVSLRRPAAVTALGAFRPDVGIVAAYGKILRRDVLEIPLLGHLNVHASLLPRWRGAWPIGAAILAGDVETGTTIMRLDEGMDTGPLLASRAESIGPDDTTGALERRLAVAGGELLVETLPAYVRGELVPRAQDDGLATYCHTVSKSDGLIDWSRPAVAIERHVRAMSPWPGAHTTWEGRQLRVLAARVAPGGGEGGAPGTVGRVGKSPVVATGAGGLVLEEVQLEGRPPTAGAAFLNGYRAFAGGRLGGGS